MDKIVRMYHQNLSLGNYIVIEPQGQDMVDLNSSTIFNRSLSTMLQNKKNYRTTCTIAYASGTKHYKQNKLKQVLNMINNKAKHSS